jgi:integrase
MSGVLRPGRRGERRTRRRAAAPLDDQLVAALTALRKRQLEESTIAGAAYRSRLVELNWYPGGEDVITDEAGTPIHPEWCSDEFGRLLSRAGLRRITPHDCRHTTLTPHQLARGRADLDHQQVAGHYDSAFTQKTYVHASEEDLHRGQAALARIHRIA